MAWLGRMGRSKIGGLRLAAFLAAGLAVGSPLSAEERKMLVASFDKVEVIGDINVEIMTGKAPSARVSGDKRVLDALKLERVGMTLRVRLQGALNNAKGAVITRPVLVQLTTQAVKDMTVAGNGSVKISNVEQPDAVRMLVAGNGSILAENVTADKFSANINGNGRIAVNNGRVRTGKVTLDGAGQFEAPNLKMRTIRLEHSGNGMSNVQALEEADIFNSGTGNITVGGSGSCFIKQAGSAAINCARTEKGSR
ncbi:GIN domain-containing protein [Sphingorhabdus sp.]|uniref:GIN domain-containing protein n=1 Tax=Sphingorhabdus sp. TaxID=1902408 RepID=UPI00391A3BC7